MFRLLKYIVLFLLSYKVIKMLFADNNPDRTNTVPPSSEKQHINLNNDAENHTSSQHPKFSDAESIEYEEVK